MLAAQGKILLKNTVAQTETHNKVWEERQCWKQRELEEKHEKLRRSRSYPSKTLTKDDGQANCSKSERNEDPFYWTKKLHELESADSERWGHAGYKDLYPEQFDGSSSSSIKNNNDKTTLKRKRRSNSSNSNEGSHSKRSKKNKKERKKKKTKTKKKRS